MSVTVADAGLGWAFSEGYLLPTTKFDNDGSRFF